MYSHIVLAIHPFPLDLSTVMHSWTTAPSFNTSIDCETNVNILPFVRAYFPNIVSVVLSSPMKVFPGGLACAAILSEGIHNHYCVLCLKVDAALSEVSLLWCHEVNFEILSMSSMGPSNFLIFLKNGDVFTCAPLESGLHGFELLLSYKAHILCASSSRSRFCFGTSDSRLHFVTLDGSVTVETLPDIPTAITWSDTHAGFFVAYGTFNSYISFFGEKRQFLWENAHSPITCLVSWKDDTLLVGYEGGVFYVLSHIFTSALSQAKYVDPYVTAIGNIFVSNNFIAISGLTDVTVYKVSVDDVFVVGHLDNFPSSRYNSTSYLTCSYIEGFQHIVVDSAGYLTVQTLAQ